MALPEACLRKSGNPRNRPSPCHPDQRPTMPEPVQAAPADLLNWFRRHRRDLPWRGRWGQPRNPYHVWVSEIMLQQTQAEVVAPRFTAFVGRWPDIEALANADAGDVHDAWAGLGYYRRARNLHRAARMLVDAWNGRFPRTVAELKTLPGIGDYTASAIAAFAFGARTVAIDGNVTRVLARVFAINASPGTTVRRCRELGAALAPARNCREFAEALIELGALVCRPRQPRCEACPWQRACLAFRNRTVEQFPRPSPRIGRKPRYSAAFLLLNARGEILLTRQSGSGPFRGMLVLPATDWSAASPTAAVVRTARPEAASWTRIPGEVEHELSHLALRVEVHVAVTRRTPRPGERWLHPDHDNLRLPSLTRKLIAHGQEGMRRQE